jgi:hypothetical protein
MSLDGGFQILGEVLIERGRRAVLAGEAKKGSAGPALRTCGFSLDRFVIAACGSYINFIYVPQYWSRSPGTYIEHDTCATSAHDSAIRAVKPQARYSRRKAAGPESGTCATRLGFAVLGARTGALRKRGSM